jgi:hypothetical protein
MASLRKSISLINRVDMVTSFYGVNPDYSPRIQELINLICTPEEHRRPNIQQILDHSSVKEYLHAFEKEDK